MNLLEKVFGKKPLKIGKQRQYFQMMNGYTPVYTNFNGSVYEMLQTKSIINVIATDCSKAIPTLSKHNRNLEYMLQHQPNQFMNTPQFIERCAINYFCDNNAYIIPITDIEDNVIGLFPIQYDACEVVESNGVLWLVYSFSNGQKGAIEYDRVGKLIKNQYKNDLFGDSNSALQQTLEIMHSQKETLAETLKQSGTIRFMGQLSEQVIDEEDLEEQRKLFAKSNFGSDNAQMLIYDSRYKEIKQIESKPIYLDDKQQELIDDNVCAYFGVSKKVVRREFSNDYEWNSYYEGVIEPFLIKLSEEVTKMVYSKSQIINGNAVYFTSNRLQYMSTETKLAFSSQMYDRGIIDGNQVADVWQLPHYEGGDKRFIRKEYAEMQNLDDTTVQSKPIEGGNGNE